MTAHF